MPTDLPFETSQGPGEIDLAREPAFQLGALRISPSTREARWTGGVEIVEPRVMQALVCLWRSAGAVVSRDELIRRCWGGRIVGDDAINRCIAKVRQIADLAGAPTFVIETIPRVGYRLRVSAPDTVVRLVPPAAPAVAARGLPSGRVWAIGAVAMLALVAVAIFSLSRRPVAPPPSLRSVAILPIRNVTGDASLDAAADRITEDAINVTAQSGVWSVASRKAIYALSGRPLGDVELGRALHVRYVVTTSLRRDPPGYRLSYQLVDAVTAQVVSARELAAAPDGGAVPERPLALLLFEAVAHPIEHIAQEAELAKPPNDGDPENVFARLGRLQDLGRRRDIPEVERLIAIARKSLPPAGGRREEFDDMGCSYYVGLVDNGLYASRAERAAWDAAALAFADDGARTRPEAVTPHACRAQALGQLERWDEGMAEVRYIVQSHPLTVGGYVAEAGIDMARGRFRDALADAEQIAARDNDPGDSAAPLGLAHLFLGQYPQAVEALRDDAVVHPRDPTPAFLLAAALELAGRHQEAAEAAQRYTRLKSDDGAWSMLAMSREPAFLARATVIRAALHRAGLVEPAGRMADR